MTIDGIREHIRRNIGNDIMVEIRLVFIMVRLLRFILMFL